jgi:hypothetical protein
MKFLSLSRENHLFNGTKKEQNANELCKDSNPALQTAKVNLTTAPLAQ